MKRSNDGRQIQGFNRRLIKLWYFLVVIVIQFSFGNVVAVGQELSTEAYNNFMVQTSTLHAQKESLSEIQKKVDFSIIRYLHTKVLNDWQETLPKYDSNVKLVGPNEILVDITANVSNSLLTLIINNGGTIINKFPQYNAIRARIPILVVEVIAAHTDVKYIARAAESTTNKLTTSEGDIAHNAPYVRGQSFTGTGVQVGVLSDSADYLAQVQATGDLPPVVTVLEDDPGRSGEGTAMMEIVYDLAPNAQLYFATADFGPANFANNIISLKNAGCKVIIDDVSYYNESPSQDDVISQAVRTVSEAGVLYFSSAGNDRNFNAGTAGTWEGDFVANSASPEFSNYHAYPNGAIFNQILSNPRRIDLFWSDPLGASANDYDLYVVDGSGNVKASSTNRQTGTQDPYESISVSNSNLNYTNYYVAIHKYSGSGRFLHLQAYRGKLNYATHGSTKGHHTVETAFGVSAVSAQGRTTPFTGSEPLETYTSDGPRRIFYNPNGTAITPGNLSSSGGLVRVKPDITAADCVETSTPGFAHFCGTSAAAPHAGAIAALFLSASPSPTPAQIRIAMTTADLPSPAFWNEDAGHGIVMADLALPVALAATTRQLLWAGTGGYASTWTFNGSNNYTGSNAYGPFIGWTPVNYSYNPFDGTRTLLWAGTGGYARIWTFNSSNNYTGSQVYGPYSGWTPVNYAYNPFDAIRTLLWAGTGGYAGYADTWTLDGSNNFTTYNIFGPYSGWTPVSYSYNPTDGTRTLLWAGTGGYVSIWTFDSSNNYTTYKEYGPYSGWTPVSYSYNSDGTRTLLWAGSGGYAGYADIWTLDGSNNLTTYIIYGPYSGWTPVQYE